MGRSWSASRLASLLNSGLDSGLASPESKSRYVRRLFSTIADRYDLITVLLSYGQDRRWKKRLVSMASITSQTRVLDLACGTGDLTFACSDHGASAVGLDVTPRMVELARRKRSRGRQPSFLVGDMMGLPFADQSFDVVTTGYGIRNVPRIAPAMAEIRRVLRPGGVWLSLDFDRPENGVIRVVYLSYLTVVGSTLGFALHGDPDTYRYIPESIRRYPGARAVAELATSQGFTRCDYVPVFGGFMAIHQAVR